MSPTEKQVLEDALRLPEQARAELAGALLESLDPVTDVDADEAWQTEVRRRIAELDSGAVETISEEEFFRSLGA